MVQERCGGGSGDPTLVGLIVDGSDLLAGGGLEASVVLVCTWLARDSGAGFGMRLVADLTPEPDPSGDTDRWRLHSCLYHTTYHKSTLLDKRCSK